MVGNRKFICGFWGKWLHIVTFLRVIFNLKALLCRIVELDVEWRTHCCDFLVCFSTCWLDHPGFGVYFIFWRDTFKVNENFNKDKQKQWNTTGFITGS